MVLEHCNSTFSGRFNRELILEKEETTISISASSNPQPALFLSASQAQGGKAYVYTNQRLLIEEEVVG